VLLVEADLDARTRHEATLSSAGYTVTTVAACPDSHEVLAADVVLSDIPSFHWLQDQRIRRMPPIVALAADARGGVTACLCGAAAWVPADGDGAYLLDTVDGVLHPTKTAFDNP
jgi:DNA-binding response OmpR family regulator